MAVSIIDMSHFADIRDPAVEVPAAARRIGEYYGSIVSAASAWWFADLEMHSAIRCRRRPGRKPCGGHIRLILDTETDAIAWACSHCADRGCISGWRESPWDLSTVRVAEYGAPGWIELPLPLDDYRLLLRQAIPDPETERVVRAAQTARSGILLSAPHGAFVHLADWLADKADHARRGKTRATLDRICDRISGALRAELG